jgi:Arm DNA-binding domain
MACKLTNELIGEKCIEHAGQHKAGEGKTRIYYDDNKASPPGFGVRVTAKGTAAFVVNYYARGFERRKTIGPWGEKKPKLSITAARVKANKLRSHILAGEDPVEDERQAKEAKRVAAEARRAREHHTLAALVAAYVGDLRRHGKPSALAVEQLFERSVAQPFPKIAALPLEDVTVEAVLPAVQKLTKADMYRSAERLSSYLRTAFNKARTARTDASGHAYSEFNVRANPLADLRVSRPEANAEASRQAEDERLWTLSQPELAAYWKRIKAQGDAYGAMLRLHLLTGGQRREQLARIIRSDYKPDARTLRLWDAKGRRKKAREHIVPLLDEAEAAILAMAGDRGHHLFTTSRGATAATPAMLDHAMTRVSEAMVDAGEIRRTITPGAIRRTVETLLGDRAVSLEARGQLQSHGLSTVQHRHYDMGKYLQQKRDALEALRQLCEATPDNVTPITRKRKAAKAA